MRQEQRSKKEVIMSQKQRYKDHPAGFAPVLDCSKQRGAFYLSHHQFFFLDQTLNLAYAETWFGHFVSKCNFADWERKRRTSSSSWTRITIIMWRLDRDKGYQFKGQGTLQVRQYQSLIDGTCSFVFVVVFLFLVFFLRIAWRHWQIASFLY